ncbi:predicted protein [Plenodomus lingam JN3]|uniref:Predicted protein n=1 Tax=Leptosphaeria maculans (strain JN3 / isolate v23.1.3 / race Av1-4-5-6-7-8) TaxID=985895 RepID=E5AFP7_LEPMJ|nr:predicted protein [Plenodomus lingam JN3]CBY02036.1 predicted protein [Plenodomus lingam JN3]
MQKGTATPPLTGQQFCRTANDKILDPQAAVDEVLGQARVGPCCGWPLHPNREG